MRVHPSGLVVLFPLVTSVLFGCSGTGASVFGTSPSNADAGPPATPLPSSDTFSAGDADASSASGSCTPADMGGWQPTWTPPEAFAEGACSATQIAGYYTACLASPIDPATCTQYTLANEACFACLDSSDTDAKLGPVVWHLNREYYTVNVAGCLAHVLANDTPTGCGAIYGETVECQEQACNGCFMTANPSFTDFAACEDQAASNVCKGLHDSIGPACGNLDSGPPQACFPAKGATAQQAFMLLAPLYCGGG
jgi:hypothetical protein